MDEREKLIHRLDWSREELKQAHGEIPVEKLDEKMVFPWGRREQWRGLWASWSATSKSTPTSFRS